MEHNFAKRVGGRLCLDFVNTVHGRIGNHPVAGRVDYADRVVGDRLVSYEALLRWGTLASALTEGEAGALAREASARPAEADAVLERSMVVRESMYRVFKAAIEEWVPKPEDLAVLNQELRVARAHERLVASPRFGWGWDGATAELDRVLWPVAVSAAELLTSPDLDRVGQCPGVECGWLFLDVSRSRRRRWCDMADCGNLAKVRGFRERNRRPH